MLRHSLLRVQAVLFMSECAARSSDCKPVPCAGPERPSSRGPVVQQSLAPLAMSPHLEETHGNKRLEVCLPSRRHDESMDDRVHIPTEVIFTTEVPGDWKTVMTALSTATKLHSQR